MARSNLNVKVQKSPLDQLLSMTSHFDAVKKQAGDDGDGDDGEDDDDDGDDNSGENENVLTNFDNF